MHPSRERDPWVTNHKASLDIVWKRLGLVVGGKAWTDAVGESGKASAVVQLPRDMRSGAAGGAGAPGDGQFRPRAPDSEAWAVVGPDPVVPDIHGPVGDRGEGRVGLVQGFSGLPPPHMGAQGAPDLDLQRVAAAIVADRDALIRHEALAERAIPIRRPSHRWPVLEEADLGVRIDVVDAPAFRDGPGTVCERFLAALPRGDHGSGGHELKHLGRAGASVCG